MQKSGKLKLEKENFKRTRLTEKISVLRGFF